MENSPGEAQRTPGKVSIKKKTSPVRGGANRIVTLRRPSCDCPDLPVASLTRESGRRFQIANYGSIRIPFLALITLAYCHQNLLASRAAEFDDVRRPLMPCPKRRHRRLQSRAFSFLNAPHHPGERRAAARNHFHPNVIIMRMSHTSPPTPI